MTVTTGPGTEWEDALGRSAVYALLSRGLAHPVPAHRREMEERILPLVLELDLGPLGPLVTDAVEQLGGPLDEQRRAHLRLFPAVESQDCPAFETGYVPGDVFHHADVMADVAGFYRAHGLQTGGEERERPDHIGTELEFMSFMARKEAHALECLGPEHVDVCRRTQRLFLRDHLGCWGAAFGRRVAATAEPPYRALGTLLAAWLEKEMASYGVEPARRLDEPQPFPEPEDGECGISVETPVQLGGEAR